MPSAPDLAALLAAVAQHDREAFGRLYDATAPKLLGVVLRILRDRGAAEDVVQDAYLKVWQGASSFSPDAGRPMTWLISIARHQALDVARRRRDAPPPETADGSDWLESVADGRDREGEFAELDRLRRCLGGLDETQRGCLLAAYYDGYSREELAERYGRPVNTIKTWLHRSTQAVRACLDAS